LFNPTVLQEGEGGDGMQKSGEGPRSEVSHESSLVRSHNIRTSHFFVDSKMQVLFLDFLTKKDYLLSKMRIKWHFIKL
jgi:hypothetical protein